MAKFVAMPPGEFAKLNSQTGEQRIDILRRLMKNGEAMPTVDGVEIVVKTTPENKEAIDRLSDIGEQSVVGTTIGGVKVPGAMELAQTGLEQTQFQPFTVTSTTGGEFGVTPTEGGGVAAQMALSPEEQAFRQNMFGGAGDFFTQAQVDPRVREEEIYGQISEALAPEQRAQQLGLEERLAAQGRLGVRTAEFGGTPEALAMQKAQAQQLSQARLGAAQQARQEQAGLAALGQQYLGAGLSLINI